MMMRGLRYRTWARILHRFNLHHTRRSGPLVDDEGDGAYLIRCDWCGLSQREPVDRFAKIRRAKRQAEEAAEATSRTTDKPDAA